MSDYIPSEVMVEIFSRLPVKSLIRFMCVSKSWRSIISSSDFMKTHLARSSIRPSLLISCFSSDRSYIEHFTLHNHDGTVDYYLKLDLPLKKQFRPRFVGACNGVFCLSNEGFPQMQAVLLWNPSIRRYVTLPLPELITNIHSSQLSFGFDLKTLDYKVVRIVFFGGGEGTQKVYFLAEVYSLRSDCWKRVSSTNPFCDLTVLLSEQVYFNGACLFIGFKQSSNYDFHLRLMSFDLGDDVFRMIDTLEVMNGGSFTFDAGIRLFQNMVSVYRVEERGNCSSLSIWVMKEFGVVESWSKMYSLDYEGYLGCWMRGSDFACHYMESLALLSGSSMDLQAPPHHGDFALPSWLPQVDEEEADNDGIKTDANYYFGLSVTSVLGNLVEFLLKD